MGGEIKNILREERGNWSPGLEKSQCTQKVLSQNLLNWMGESVTGGCRGIMQYTECLRDEFQVLRKLKEDCDSEIDEEKTTGME